MSEVPLSRSRVRGLDRDLDQFQHSRHVCTPTEAEDEQYLCRRLSVIATPAMAFKSARRVRNRLLGGRGGALVVRGALLLITCHAHGKLRGSVQGCFAHKKLLHPRTLQ